MVGQHAAVSLEDGARRTKGRGGVGLCWPLAMSTPRRVEKSATLIIAPLAATMAGKHFLTILEFVRSTDLVESKNESRAIPSTNAPPALPISMVSSPSAGLAANRRTSSTNAPREAFGEATVISSRRSYNATFARSMAFPQPAKMLSLGWTHREKQGPERITLRERYWRRTSFTKVGETAAAGLSPPMPRARPYQRTFANPTRRVPKAAG